MESKLGLNFELVNRARASAAKIADDTQHFIDQHTTVTVERAVCRLLGIDGVNDMDVPLPNVVVDHLMANSLLPVGAAWAIGNAMVETGKDPQGVADAVNSGELDLSKVPAHSDAEIRGAITPVVNATVDRINKNVAKRNSYLKAWGDKEGPYLYIIVATGNIYEDITQAKAGAKQGADIIAVIRTTGQSLLDYVPYGATTEGFGGTYATQENFRLMRAALDEVGEEQHRYIRLCNYCSGLCMPEIAAMGALERLDVMLNDALYGILFRDINMQRTIVDQYFSRVINGYAGVIINTGEDNYLTTDDAITAAHTVLASQVIYEAFSKTADAEGYEIVVDTHGTLLWDESAEDERPLLILLSEQVSKEHLAYLNGKHISWIACGKEHVDLKRACELLAVEFGIQRAAVVGGGHINAGFLAAGLLDEGSILIGAGIDGRGGMQSVFDGLPMERGVTPLKLTGVQQYGSGAVWLRYNVEK